MTPLRRSPPPRASHLTSPRPHHTSPHRTPPDRTPLHRAKINLISPTAHDRTPQCIPQHLAASRTAERPSTPAPVSPGTITIQHQLASPHLNSLPKNSLPKNKSAAQGRLRFVRGQHHKHEAINGDCTADACACLDHSFNERELPASNLRHPRDAPRLNQRPESTPIKRRSHNTSYGLTPHGTTLHSLRFRASIRM